MSKKTKKSKSKTKTKKVAPLGKFVEVEAKLPLTDGEKVKRGELACQKLNERDKLTLERKSVADEYKSRINALDSEAKKLLLEFTEGREIRTVKAKEIRNFTKSQVEYHWKGQVIHSRTMTLADRQDELPIKDKNVPLVKVSALESEKKTQAEEPKTVTRRVNGLRVVTPAPDTARDPVAAAHQKDEDAKRADIASVIRDETSTKSKWSPVDGERPRA